MTMHIKKIMDGMIILTFLSRSFSENASEYFYRQVKKLICKGYKDILVDLTNVYVMDNKVIDVLYELNKLVIASGGTIKLFGVNQEVADIIDNSQYGNVLRIQRNEVIEDDLFDLTFGRQISLAC